MTSSNWSIVTWIVRIRDLGNEVNNNSVPSLKKLPIFEELLNYLNYIIINNKPRSLIEFAIVSIQALSFFVRDTP